MVDKIWYLKLIRGRVTQGEILQATAGQTLPEDPRFCCLCYCDRGLLRFFFQRSKLLAVSDSWIVLLTAKGGFLMPPRSTGIKCQLYMEALKEIRWEPAKIIDAYLPEQTRSGFFHFKTQDRDVSLYIPSPYVKFALPLYRYLKELA